MMTHAKFHFNRLMLTLIFGVWASEPPRAWRTTEKAGPDRVKSSRVLILNYLDQNSDFTSITRIFKI